MIDIGFLEECGASKWAFPSFIYLKKKVVSDKSLIYNL